MIWLLIKKKIIFYFAHRQIAWILLIKQKATAKTNLLQNERLNECAHWWQSSELPVVKLTSWSNFWFVLFHSKHRFEAANKKNATRQQINQVQKHPIWRALCGAKDKDQKRLLQAMRIHKLWNRRPLLKLTADSLPKVTKQVLALSGPPASLACLVARKWAEVRKRESIIAHFPIYPNTKKRK